MNYGVEKIRQRQDGRGRGAPVGRRSLKGALLELVLERDADDLRDVVLPVLAQEERGPVCQLALAKLSHEFRGALALDRLIEGEARQLVPSGGPRGFEAVFTVRHALALLNHALRGS